MNRMACARALSIVGHPALLMPGAVVLSAVGRQATAGTVLAAVAATAFVALAVIGYSVLQVRAGRWTHVDASVPHERGQLNLFLAALLFATAAALWWLGQPPSLATGLAAGGLLVVLAYALGHWLKMSLHVAFAVFAAALLWPDTAALGTVLLLAAGVSWSRLALRRHTPLDVAIGGLAGGAAGLGFQWLAGA